MPARDIAVLGPVFPVLFRSLGHPDRHPARVQTRHGPSPFATWRSLSDCFEVGPVQQDHSEYQDEGSPILRHPCIPRALPVYAWGGPTDVVWSARNDQFRHQILQPLSSFSGSHGPFFPGIWRSSCGSFCSKLHTRLPAGQAGKIRTH